MAEMYAVVHKVKTSYTRKKRMSQKQFEKAIEEMIGQVGAPPGEAPKGFADEYNYANQLMEQMGLNKKKPN